MKSPVELNSLLSKFFCYITWLLYQLTRRDTGQLANEALHQILLLLNYKLKSVFWKNSQNSQENTHVGVFFSKKLHAFRLVLYYNRNTRTGFFLWILRIFRNNFFYEKSPWDWKRILKASHCYYLWHMNFVLPNLQNIL